MALSLFVGPPAKGQAERRGKVMAKVTHEFDLYGKHY